MEDSVGKLANPQESRSSARELSLFGDEDSNTDSPSHSASPFVKWAGGKRRLVPAILASAPSSFRRYLEPFAGGGAVALALAHPVMLLNDANPELMNAYRAVKSDATSLMKLLDQHRERHSETYFYYIRQQRSEVLSPLEQGARLIYLNKTCFNGLFRVNRSGQFNVPYGFHESPTLYDEQALRRASEVLRGAELFTGDYQTFLDEHARAGDFIYLDPPYIPVGKFSDFKRYTKDQFRGDNQETLKQTYLRLIERGCYPLLSNSWTARDLYADQDVIELLAARNINKNGAGRKAVPEILVKPRGKTA